MRLELRAAEQARDAYRRELAGENPVMLPDMSAAGRLAALPSTTRGSTRSASNLTNCCAAIPTSILMWPPRAD